MADKLVKFNAEVFRGNYEDLPSPIDEDGAFAVAIDRKNKLLIALNGQWSDPNIVYDDYGTLLGLNAENGGFIPYGQKSVYRVITDGDSISAQDNAYKWFEALFKGTFRKVKASGVGGETMSQILSRINASVLNVSADVVFFCGATNDINNGETFATTAPKIEEYIKKVINNGKILIFLTPPPATGATQAKREVSQRIRQYLFAKARAIPRLFVIDSHQAIVDPTNANADPIAALMTDSLHYNGLGGNRVGVIGFADLKNIFPLGRISGDLSDVISATNPYGSFHPNITRAGTGGSNQGGATGNVADSSLHFRTSSNVTSAATKVARTDILGGWEWQRIVASWTGAASVYYYYANSADFSTFLVAGNKLYFDAEVDMNSATAVDIQMQLEVQDVSNAVLTTLTRNYQNVQPGSYMFSVEESAFPANTAKFSAKILFTGANGSAIDVYIGKMRAGQRLAV